MAKAGRRTIGLRVKPVEALKELDGMTVEELKARADELNADLTGLTKKADILEALKELD